MYIKKLISCLSIVLICFFVSCGNDSIKTMQEIPIKQSVNNKNFYQKDFAFHFSHQRGFNYSKLKVDKNIKMLLLDAVYEEVDFYEMKKFNNWFQDFKFQNGVMPIDQKENLDCDNFALLYKSLFSVSRYKSDTKKEPAVALVVVEQKRPFAGIPAGLLHMLNLVFTNNGWYIFEPQTGEAILLEDYPNQEFIKFIII
jgi:hypothetical protein